ncbi:hypothetical protein COJE103337_03850 [Corynebacterium jeikeium]|uniref:hypothetical protein n=1 Tax=Corynebacterium jeikeium TaxID=38289 RepID=UPI0001B714F9|nr:hypothetical protein [Corynebacterium jeikeium]EEW17381.1 hypothetical protein HMPREF0297_0258 [Corynebacterium jeikeium ATCC 43734]OOD30759.1 hypothetical protein BWP03_06790 [Corynebacterium jeikeium]WCZ54128.1 hypothetical protein CJEIK_08165 [Corynebacterium jeikeium]SUY80566.1 immunity-specific protein beta371 [Corynebacterium jeikeium]
MRRPYLIAESPQVTVLRSLASTAFGKVSITLPEGAEMDGIFTPSAPGNELGYVAALNSEKRVGGMFRRFVRADVSITAKGAPAPASDVEQVLDEAAKRTSGEFFLESDITLAGLGDWVPLQHFQVGDLVDVEIWGMVVPMRVTRIEPIVSDHSIVDWRVHVGGQLVSDEDALLAANATIHRVLVEDRRDLAGLSERVVAAQSSADAAGESARVADSKAVAAQATADDADGKAKKLAEALSGGGATIPTVMADLQRLNRQLQENNEGGAADQGLIPAYIAANTKRWELQEKVDKQQDELAEANRLATEANAVAIKAQEDLALAEKRENRLRPKLTFAHQSQWLHAPYDTPDGLFRIEGDKASLDRGATIVARGTWEGDAVMLMSNMNGFGNDGGTEIRFAQIRDDGDRRFFYKPVALVGIRQIVILTVPRLV